MDLDSAVRMGAGLLVTVALVIVVRFRQDGRRIWWGLGLGFVAISGVYLIAAFTREPARDWDTACPLPGQDSEYRSSTWQSWPPGTVCYDLAGQVMSRPGRKGGELIIVLAAGSVVFLTLGGLAAVNALDKRRSAAA